MDSHNFYKNFIQGVILSAVIVFGLAGNVSSLITWTKGRRCNKFPGTIYLRVLALSDTLVLCFPAAQFAILMMFETELKDLNTVTCKLYDAIGHFCALVSTWTIVCLTVQRTLAVCVPLKSTRWNNKRRDTGIITVFVILFLALNIPYGLGFKLTLSQTGLKTLLQPDGTDAYSSTVLMPTTWEVSNVSSDFTKSWDPNTINETLSPVMTRDPVTKATETVLTRWRCIDDNFAFLHKYHEWLVDVSLLFVAPFSFLIVCNVILLTKLFRRHDVLAATDSFTGKRYGKDFRFVTMTTRIVSISVTHCVLVGPVAVTGLIPGFPLSTYIMLHVLFFLNHSVNFVFYSFIGTAFRRDLMELCCKRGYTERTTVLSSVATIEKRD